MAALTTKELTEAFTEKLTARLDAERLEGPVRLDNTRTVVIIPVKGKGDIFVQIRGSVDGQGVDSVLRQIQAAPGLKGLVRAA